MRAKAVKSLKPGVSFMKPQRPDIRNAGRDEISGTGRMLPQFILTRTKVTQRQLWIPLRRTKLLLHEISFLPDYPKPEAG